MSIAPSHEIIVQCPFDEQSARSAMGESEYSYYFVMRRFMPLLASRAKVTVIGDAAHLDEACAGVRASGREPMLLMFAPPHRAPKSSPCPLVPVFAWEFDTIPDEPFGTDESQDWASFLRRQVGAITHSQYAVAAVKRSIGAAIPLVSLPAPVWDEHACGSDLAWTGAAREIRFRGILLDSTALGLDREPTFEPLALEPTEQRLRLSGTVFTSVLNPKDGRKNWREMLSAFVWPLRDDPHATLVLKLVHHDLAKVCEEVLLELRKLAPYRCRIVAVAGFLESDAYRQLVHATAFTVNSSLGEGQCLPLMEFMSAGRPAIAPNHTAMAEYVDDSNAFVVESSAEWTHWPQDPRRRLKCLRQRIDWESLCRGFEGAASLARADLSRYRAMSSRAADALERYCSRATVEPRLDEFLHSLPPTVALGRMPAAPDSLHSQRT